MNDLNTNWDFVEKYYPNYYGCDLIALNDDLQKIVGGEAEDGSDAQGLFINEYGEDIDAVQNDLQKTTLAIYEKAIQGYIKEQQNKITISWSIYDVLDTAKDNHDIILTLEQAQNILKEIEHTQDANIGVNWDVIDQHIEMELERQLIAE